MTVPPFGGEVLCRLVSSRRADLERSSLTCRVGASIVRMPQASPECLEDCWRNPDIVLISAGTARSVLACGPPPDRSAPRYDLARQEACATRTPEDRHRLPPFQGNRAERLARLLGRVSINLPIGGPVSARPDHMPGIAVQPLLT